MKMKRNLAIAAVVIVATVAGLLYWNNSRKTASATEYQTAKAERGTLTASIGATGTVRANQSTVLTWQTSGIVEVVNVQIGDKVNANDILASLSQTSLPQSIILAESDLVSAQKSLDDLLQSGTSSAQAAQSQADAQKAVEDSQKKVDSLTFPRASDELIQKTEAQIDLARRQVALTADSYRSLRSKPDGNPTKAQAELDMTNAQINLNNLIAQYNWYVGQPTATDAAQYRANLAVAKAQLADAQRQLGLLKNGPNADDVAAAQAKVAAAQATLNQAKIIAPFDGIVTETDPQKGDKVAAGATAFRVDNMSSLLVDLKVSEVDINSIAIGQPVTVSFDAVQGKSYSGEVVKIGQAGDVTTNGVNFTVTVQLTEVDELVKPGMTAAVTITVREVKDALLIPNRTVRQLNGKKVVYVLQNGLPVAVEVRLGATSDTVSEVVGGDLKDGDLVILNPPTTTTFGPGGGGMFGGG
jgi:HlyD family secretion protein